MGNWKLKMKVRTLIYIVRALSNGRAMNESTAEWYDSMEWQTVNSVRLWVTGKEFEREIVCAKHTWDGIGR